MHTAGYHVICLIWYRSRLKFGSRIDPEKVDFPNKAKIVIVGGGAQGMAIAYKLAKQSYGEDIVVIDQVGQQNPYYISVHLLKIKQSR